jgi:hypothetical protein
MSVAGVSFPTTLSSSSTLAQTARYCFSVLIIAIAYYILNTLERYNSHFTIILLQSYVLFSDCKIYF